MKYAVWNNKGGVGKTFLSFTLATELAHRDPDKHVVVIDMCPQANISEILLGANSKGAKTINEMIQSNKTISGYFNERIRSPHIDTGTESDFLILPHEYHKDIPENLSLIVGDPALELQVQTINNISVQELPEESWKNVHSWVIDLIKAARRSYSSNEPIFIIDCNPSFSSYTEQALLAADRLIVPCSADGSSARAIRNVGRLLYGIGVPDFYKKTSFHAKVRENNMSSPKIHSVVLNRTTVYRDKPSKAFAAMQEQVEKEVSSLHESDKSHDYFSQERSSLIEYMPDAHTVAVVSSSLGIPLYSLRVGPYTVEGTKTQINDEPLDRYKREISTIVDKLIKS